MPFWPMVLLAVWSQAACACPEVPSLGGWVIARPAWLVPITAVLALTARRCLTHPIRPGRVAALTLAAALCLVLSSTPAHRNTGHTSCGTALRQLGLAALCYAQDYDERLPDSEQWPGQLEPYVKSPASFTCPAEPGTPLGYAMNAAVSGRSLQTIPDLSRTVLFYCALAPGIPGLSRHYGRLSACYTDAKVNVAQWGDGAPVWDLFGWAKAVSP